MEISEYNCQYFILRTLCFDGISELNVYLLSI